MAIQGCRNAIEELVVEETKTQIMRLSSGVKAKTSIDDVAAYALNRLPPMYATTRRGYIQQQKRAYSELKQEISQTISRGLIGVRKDSLKDKTALPQTELEREERSLLKLQEVFGNNELRWRDVPKALESVLMDIKLKGAVSYSNYQSKAVRSASNVSSYLKRHSEEISWKSNSKPLIEDSIIQMTDMREFASYMAPASWNFINTLENLVCSIAQRQISRIDSSLTEKVSLEEVSAYALNRLPPMYATTENGLKYWRDRARNELSTDILLTVRQGIVTILKSPSRFLPPLPSDKFSTEQEVAIAELRDILQINDIDWRNVAMVIKDAIEQSKRGEIVWISREHRNQSNGRMTS